MPTCVCLEGPSWADIERQRRAASSVADLWELRVDRLDPQALSEVAQHLERLRDRPIVLTSRSKDHGGAASNHPQDQIARRNQLAAWNPDYLDVEWPISTDELSSLRSRSPGTKIIVSWHGELLPASLQEALTQDGPLRPDLWKLAPHCPHADAWMHWQTWWEQRSHLHGRLLFQPQGPLGVLQRLWSSRWKEPWVFLTDSAGREGAVSPQDWVQVYRMSHLTWDPHLRLLGLVGDPVAQSRGRLFHNRWMETSGWSGRYAPIRCSAEHWHRLWPWLRAQSAGLAVTTPLKQVVVDTVNQLDPLAAAASSVSALVRLPDRNGGDWWLGANTDGPAAVSVMGGADRLRGKRVLVLGAGGVGRAVALACVDAGARVTLCVRRPEAVEIAIRQVVDVATIAQWPQLVGDQDWIVQATTCGFLDQELPVDPRYLSGQAVLEIVQRETPFLQAAVARGCRVVRGVDMFVQLSKLQAQLWTGGLIAEALLDEAAAVARQDLRWT